jgi:hypothetical protein
MLTVVPACEQKEYSVSMPVHDIRGYDVRGYDPEAPSGIFTFGGFIGELIIALSSLNDSIMSKGENAAFEMKSETIMRFLEDLLLEGYPQGICFLHMTHEPLTELDRAVDADKKASLVAIKLASGVSLAGYGMKFLLKFGINAANIPPQIVADVLDALC